MRNPVRCGGWVLLACLSLPVWAADPLTLAEAQRIAASRAPQIQASLAQERSAQEMAVAAGQLPDPVLKVGVNNVPVSGEAGWSVVQESMTMRSVALMQEFTRADKRAARTERAQREADLARVSASEALADVRRETALDWFELAHQRDILQLIDRQLAELEVQTQASEAGWRSGRGSEAEVFAARLATERMRDQQAQTRRDIAMTRERLARWIGAEAQRDPASLPPTDKLGWQVETLDQDVSMHPTLSAAHGQVALAEADAKLARANRKPDVSVELMYSMRGPDYANMVSLNLSMPLPWDRANRQDREVSAKAAQLEEAQARQDDARHGYLAMLRETLASWQSSRARLVQYDETLIPLAARQTAAALAAYRAGSGTLGGVLEARRMALDTGIERQRIALEADKAWAQLEFLNPQKDSGRGEQP
jgi:outer membrane protein TolC